MLSFQQELPRLRNRGNAIKQEHGRVARNVGTNRNRKNRAEPRMNLVRRLRFRLIAAMNILSGK